MSHSYLILMETKSPKPRNPVLFHITKLLDMWICLHCHNGNAIYNVNIIFSTTIRYLIHTEYPKKCDSDITIAAG